MRKKGSKPNKSREFICLRCGIKFVGPNCNTKYCKPCRPLRCKENGNIYYKATYKNRLAYIRKRRREPEYRKKQNEWNQKWRKRNLDKLRFLRRKHQRNRVLQIKSRGNYSYEEWIVLLRKTGNCCLICKKQEPEIKLSVDHIIPLSKGGSNNIENIQPLCISCNCKKWKN